MTRLPILLDHEHSALTFILDLMKTLLHAASAGDDADQHLRKLRRLDLAAGPSVQIPSEQAATMHVAARRWIKQPKGAAAHSWSFKSSHSHNRPSIHSRQSSRSPPNSQQRSAPPTLTQHSSSIHLALI
jgi:hypothetical protein